MGQLLDEATMMCRHAPLDEYLKFLASKIDAIKVRSKEEIDAKALFSKEVRNLLAETTSEKEASAEQMKGKVKGLIEEFIGKTSYKELDSKCSKSDYSKDFCDLFSKMKQHLNTLKTGVLPEECGAEQAFDFTALKCVDKELADMGLEILAKITSEKTDDANVDTIQKSLQDTLSELLNLFKTEGYTDSSIIESLKKQSVTITKTLQSLCTDDDEKAPYCTLVVKIATWFDQVVYEKTPCTNGQIFSVDMSRRELQCLDLDFVKFMKKLTNGYLAEIDPESPEELKEFQRKVQAMLDSAMTSYESASATDSRTTSQRQEDFLKAFKTHVKTFTGSLSKVCPAGEEFEWKSCRMVLKLADHVGHIINNVESCPHEQIFDFNVFKCVDVIFVDYAKQALQEIDKHINKTSEEGSIFERVKQSLDLVMKKFIDETTKAGEVTTKDRFAEFEKVLRAEAKKVIDVFLPYCEVKESTDDGPSIEDSGCKTVHSIFEHYKKLLDSIGVTKCPLGEIFDEEGLRCVDMHVVDYAQKILDWFQKDIEEDKKKEMEETPGLVAEKNVGENFISALKAFIVKVKTTALTTDTSAVKLEKVKEHGEAEMKAMIGGLAEYCDPANEDPMCRKALVFGQNVAGFLFNNMFTTGCGLDEIFNLKILKCMNAGVYDSLKDVFAEIRNMKSDSNTGQVVLNSMSAVLPTLVDHVKDQATNPTVSIDIFNALLHTVKDEIKPIIDMTDSLCKDVLTKTNPEDKIEHNINYAMCYMVKNVTRHFQKIADSKWESGDAKCGGENKDWEESILDCLDIHFILFLEKIVNEAMKQDDSLRSIDTMYGKLMHVFKRVFDIYKKGDHAGKGMDELMKDFLRNVRDGGADVMRDMAKICKDIVEEDEGDDTMTICTTVYRVIGNFGANLVADSKGGESCKEGQLIDVEMLKCVDVAFMSMVQKMMTMMENHFGEHMTDLDKTTVKTIHHFIDTIMVESRRHEVSVAERQDNLMVYIVQESKDVMKVLGDYCSRQQQPGVESFEYKLCSLATQLGSTMTKAMLFTTGKRFDEFVESVLTSLKFLKSDDPDVVALKSMLDELHGVSLKAFDDAEEAVGQKYMEKLVAAKGKLKPLMEAADQMCSADEKAETCRVVKEELDKFTKMVSQTCDGEGEVFDLKKMRCEGIESPKDFFLNQLEYLNKLVVGADDTNAKELLEEWKKHVAILLGKAKEYENKDISKEQMKTIANSLKGLFDKQHEFCKTVMAASSLNRDVNKETLCRAGDGIKKTIERLMESEEGESSKNLCHFVESKAEVKKCPKGESFCPISRMCLTKGKVCKPSGMK